MHILHNNYIFMTQRYKYIKSLNKGQMYNTNYIKLNMTKT